MAHVSTIQKAYEVLYNQGIKGVLVGTGALQLWGVAVDAPDIDFIVERRPDTSSLVQLLDSPDGSCSGPILLDGVKVDYIPHDFKAGGGSWEWVKPLFIDRAHRHLFGVPTADVASVIKLKQAANRPKDREFIKRFQEGDLR